MIRAISISFIFTSLIRLAWCVIHDVIDGKLHLNLHANYI